MAPLEYATRRLAPARPLRSGRGFALASLMAPLLTGTLMLPACGRLPSDGPLVAEVVGETHKPNRLPYQLITLAPELLPVIADGDAQALETFIGDTGVGDIRVGPGDLLTVTVVEPGAGGLFTPPPSNGVIGGEQGAKVVALPVLRVNEQGNINVPFAGNLNVRGHSTTEVARQIEAALTGQAITPHVIVSMDTKSNRFTMSGSVKNPGLFQMDEHGVTLLGGIAEAGGMSEPPNDTVVQLTRFGHVHLIRMQSLLDNPESDIHIRAGDIITTYAQPRTYLVLGATMKVANEKLPRDRLTLAEALGKAGGLDDKRADSGSLFLFRFERRDIVERILAVDAKLARRRGEIVADSLDQRTAAKPPETLIPVIYTVNLRSGTGMFLANMLAIREKDMMFAANAESVQWQKFLDLLRVTVSPLEQGAVSAAVLNKF